MIQLRPLALARALGLIAFLLALASLSLQLVKFWTGRDYIFGLVGMFSLNDEQNIPAMFASTLLLFASLLLLVITLLEKDRSARDVSKWAILSAGFLLMAIDETVSLHELLIEPTRQLLGPGNLGIFYFAWVIPGIALVLALGLFFLPFLLRIPGRTRSIFFVAAFLYLGGALGVELMEGRHAEIHGKDLVFHILVTVEESLEMAGAILFIYGLLRYLAVHHPETRFVVIEAKADAERDNYVRRTTPRTTLDLGLGDRD